jgi:ribonuclease HI
MLRKSLLNGNLELQARIAAINEKIATLDAKLNTDSQINLEQIHSMYRNRLHRVSKPSK